MADVKDLGGGKYEIHLSNNEQALVEQDSQRNACTIETCIVVWIEHMLESKLHSY